MPLRFPRRHFVLSSAAVGSGLVIPAALASEPTSAPEAAVSRRAVLELERFLRQGGSYRDAAAERFASVALLKRDAKQARDRLNASRTAEVHQDRQRERDANELIDGELRMPLFIRIFGEEPPQGHSVFISMHGGGNAPAAVNEQQWQNQQRLYEPTEGIYVAPLAPTNTWNLWHEPHIDRLFDRLIDMLAVTERANRNRVYLMGYSAGGDGVYQLAPRMADRWAAAAMMAGHPNDASPLSLRNVPFAVQVGGRDAAYNRNTVAAEWGDQLKQLHEADPEGYEHFVKIYPEHAHWMHRDDAVALPWMASHTRNPVPTRVVWRQDDVLHPSFYWLAADAANRKAYAQVIANIEGQQISIESTDLANLTVHLDDRLVDLEQPVVLIANGRASSPIRLNRTIATLATTLAERGDPDLAFTASVAVGLSPGAA
jgi:dienelactone hydrolase